MSLTNELRNIQLMREKYFVITLLGVFGFLLFTTMLMNSQTMDEWNHMSYGLKILESGDTRRDAEGHATKMPVSVLHALPYWICQKLGWEEISVRPTNSWIKRLLHANEEFPCWMAGRMASVVFSLVLVSFVFKWSRQLYGEKAGRLSLFVSVFCPNVLAHSVLMTTDIPYSAMTLVSVYYLWESLKFRSRSAWVKCSVAFGLCQLTKYLAVLMIPVFVLVIALAKRKRLSDFWNSDRNWRVRLRIAEIVHLLFAALLFVGLALLIVNAGFLFRKTGLPMEDFQFESKAFEGLQAKFKFGRFPIPLPFDYLCGLDKSKHFDEEGIAYGGLYLLGHSQEGDARRGWWYYFLVCLFLKVPIATLIMIGMCFWLALGRNDKKPWDSIFLLVPTVVFLYASCFIRSQIGVRYVLPVLPFLYVWAGQLADQKIVRPIVLKALCVWLAISCLSYYPFFIPYFNEVIGARKNAYLYLDNSNLNWSQSSDYIHQWLQDHPHVKTDLVQGNQGLVLVDTNWLTGNFGGKSFEWLRLGYVPLRHVAYTHLLYDLSRDPVSNN